MLSSAAIHVALTLDEGYFPHGAAMLRSMFTNHRSTPLHIHLLHDSGLGTAAVRQFERFVLDLGGAFTAHQVPDDWLQDIPAHPHYLKSVWLKIFTPRLIGQSRLIYLDGDLIVRTDLLPLWQIQLGEAWLAAVRDSMPWGAMFGNEDAHLIRMGLMPPEPGFNRSKHLARLGLSRPEEYFNVGVMLLDLDRMRGEDLCDRLLEYAVSPHTLKIYPEQDAFNALSKGRWYSLPAYWNAVHDNLSNTPVEAPLTPDELHEARFAPRIFHFCGFMKPWQPQSRHPLRKEYIGYRKATPWGGAGPYEHVDLLGRLYLSLPLAWRVQLYGLPMRYHIGRARLQRWPNEVLHGHWWRNRPLWIRPRYVGGALLLHLPKPWAARLRRVFASQPAPQD